MENLATSTKHYLGEKLLFNNNFILEKFLTPDF
jgi:hypothetical protein